MYSIKAITVKVKSTAVINSFGKFCSIEGLGFNITNCFNENAGLPSFKRKNMYAGLEPPQMNGDTPHDSGHGGGGGGHQVGEELQRTRK